MKSVIYEGTVSHARYQPREHRFDYRLFMLYLDLAELPELFDRYWFWSARRPGLAWFRRKDFFGDPAQPLDQAVRDRVASETGTRPMGPIRLLTHLRYWGYGFNPVSIYYCFSPDGGQIDAVLAEVTNTPWKERRAYVLTNEAAGGEPFTATFSKQLHVSPFMGMDQHYRWRLPLPGETLSTQLSCIRNSQTLLDAGLQLRRQPINSYSLAAALIRHPFMSFKVIAAIHLQAAKLWLKRIPLHPKPSRETDPWQPQ
ncbi:MAG: DUF1365 domain-containing protein [Gammaproteobacteria bacterium]